MLIDTPAQASLRAAAPGSHVTITIAARASGPEQISGYLEGVIDVPAFPAEAARPIIGVDRVWLRDEHGRQIARKLRHVSAVVELHAPTSHAA